MKVGNSLQSPHPPIPPATTTTTTSAFNSTGDAAVGVEEEYERCNNREEKEKLEATEKDFEESEREKENSETDEEYEQLENTEIVEAEMDEAEGEKPKLADGYYEMETIRRKRVRKGQLQYLIKWRGWSEAENTWEPVDNLLQCSDIIDAFEERLKTGKSRSTRKRKRQVGITHVQTKKKQHHYHQRSPASSSYNLPLKVVRITEDPLPFAMLNDFNSINNNRESSLNGGNSLGLSKGVKDDGIRPVSVIVEEEEKEHIESNLKLCKWERAIFPSTEDANTLAITSLEGQLAGPDVLSNKLAKADLPQSGRCTGARKRKSGSVKRFKKDPESYSGNDEPLGVQHPDFWGNYTNCKNKFDDSKSMCSITQIVTPISYKNSTSNNIREVLVGFEAVRFDGTKVLVDNKFLKANNPLLLIDFYEKHLRYSPTL